MQILLTAPLDGMVDGGHAWGQQADGTKFRTRNSAVLGDLAQDIVREPDPTRYSSDAVECLEYRSVTTMGRTICFARVRWPDAASGSFDTASLEAELTAEMTRIVALAEAGDTTVKWVHRTLLLADELGVPDGWLMEGFTPETIRLVGSRREGTSKHPATAPRIRLAWGNAVASAHLPDVGDLWPHVLSGIADAQALWLQIEELSMASGAVITSITSARGEPPAGNVAQETQRLSSDVLHHDYLYDQMNTLMEGSRRAVAVAQLRSWDYPQLAERVGTRIRNIERIAAQIASQRTARYNRLVEVILLIIGLTSAIQLYLAIIGTSFSGSPDRQPDGRWGFMDWLRASDADVGFAAVSMALVALATYLIWHRGRGEK